MDTKIGEGMAVGGKPAFLHWLSWAFRILLAVTFVWAGVLKFMDPAGFAGSIATFQLLPEAWVNVVALGLPPFEILTGLLILSRRWLAVGSFSLGALSVVFLLALLSGLARGLPVDCGCFGGNGPSTPSKIWLAVARDVVLLGMAGWVYWQSSITDQSPEPMVEA
ncbi:MAG TPA: MauE/DoxX family redox-associated membrane protein [Verrucomicrobiales bacterium]|jgi:putative oxidoreductase|nr:MauE/DoxX family redox-associated membrane protein [Verrucomicrobiales bacterium]